jgi:hypothetical protein
MQSIHHPGLALLLQANHSLFCHFAATPNCSRSITLPLPHPKLTEIFSEEFCTPSSWLLMDWCLPWSPATWVLLVSNATMLDVCISSNHVDGIYSIRWFVLLSSWPPLLWGAINFLILFWSTNLWPQLEKTICNYPHPEPADSLTKKWNHMERSQSLAFYLGIESKIMVPRTDLGRMAGAGTWWHWSTNISSSWSWRQICCHFTRPRSAEHCCWSSLWLAP